MRTLFAVRAPAGAVPSGLSSRRTSFTSQYSGLELYSVRIFPRPPSADAGTL